MAGRVPCTNKNSELVERTHIGAVEWAPVHSTVPEPITECRVGYENLTRFLCGNSTCECGAIYFQLCLLLVDFGNQ